MKQLLLLNFLLPFTVFSQTFNGSSGPILDNATIDIPVIVSGLPLVIDTNNFGLESVCLDATHTYLADLSVSLVAPDGTVTPLILNIGGGDDDFTNTCFSTSSNVEIGTVSAPYTGNFIAPSQMGTVNNGQNPNGTWFLRINDNYPADQGTLNSFSITFGNNPATYFSFSSSLLPIFVINTNGNTIVDDPKVAADMKILVHSDGSRNYLTDAPGDYNGKIGLEYRGNYSLSLPQKPFAFETWDNNGLTKDTSLLGLPAENDWLLLANYNDKSFSRNIVPFHLFEKMGHYATRTRLVDVVLNGNYEGVYLLCEKIKRDSARVSVAKLDSTDVGAIDASGGYMLKIDYFDNSNSWQLNNSPIGFPGLDIHLVNVYPLKSELTLEQSNYIHNYIDDFETALYGPNFADPLLGYRQFIGTETFIDYFLISELTRNVDGYKKSRYFSKDKNKADGTVRKLKAGPVWDFDWSQKDIWAGSDDGSGFQYGEVDQDVNAPGWYIRLLQDSLFANEVRCRYEDFRRNIFSEAYIHAKIDSVAQVVAESQGFHYKIWGHLGQSTGTPEIGTPSATFAQETQKLKDWYSRRLTWLDGNMPGTLNGCSFTGIQDLVATNQLTAFPVPFKDALSIEWAKGDLKGATFSLVDLTGKIIQTKVVSEGESLEKQLTFIQLSELNAGIYFVHVELGEEKVQLKVVK